MNIYIYSDESGVFDYKHNDYFIFAGIICFGENDKNNCARKYSHAEKILREKEIYRDGFELKGSILHACDKNKLLRSLNGFYKFCVVINQKDISQKIFENKKHKQRFLDYAYKMVLKKCFTSLINRYYLKPNQVDNIFVQVDEHTTATDGKYELQENLLNEFKYGTFNFDYDCFFEPIFPYVRSVNVKFCDSKKVRLIRAADIVANYCYRSAITNKGQIIRKTNTFIYNLPSKTISGYGLDYFKNNKSI